jgi:hypothetical protein
MRERLDRATFSPTKASNTDNSRRPGRREHGSGGWPQRIDEAPFMSTRAPYRGVPARPPPHDGRLLKILEIIATLYLGSRRQFERDACDGASILVFTDRLYAVFTRAIYERRW